MTHARRPICATRSCITRLPSGSRNPYCGACQDATRAATAKAREQRKSRAEKLGLNGLQSVAVTCVGFGMAGVTTHHVTLNAPPWEKGKTP
jgi:hypothetical protein